MKKIIVSNRHFLQGDITNMKELMEKSKFFVKKDTIMFFPFWSWKVPEKITTKFICIGFHIGEYSGGSPIQNLIRKKIYETKVYAFRMSNKIDKGLRIMSCDISLRGNLEEILMNLSEKMNRMIDEIFTHYR